MIRLSHAIGAIENQSLTPEQLTVAGNTPWSPFMMLLTASVVMGKGKWRERRREWKKGWSAIRI